MKKPPRVILASGSPIRARLLKQAGLVFSQQPSDIDEARIKRLYQNTDIDQLVTILAKSKAKAAYEKNPNDLIIGADQVLVFAGRALDKPASKEQAMKRLRALRGKTHMLVGAVCLLQNQHPVWSYRGKSKLTMRKFSDKFLKDYVDKEGEDLLYTVGAYKFEGRGAQLFSKVEGDFFSILGLPLLPLLGELRARGVLMK